MSRSATLFSLALALMAGPGSVRADVGQARVYIDVDGDVLRGAPGDLTLRPMGRTEQRFGEDGLALLKTSVGLRTDVTSWLRLQAYYAHVDRWTETHHQAHLLVFDFVLHHRWRPVAVSWRIGNEWHDAGFYRLRNNLDLHLDPGVSWLRLFVSGELRTDSDQARLNMVNVRVGVDLRVDESVSFRLLYNLEINHRSKADWPRVHIAGLMLIGRF